MSCTKRTKIPLTLRKIDLTFHLGKGNFGADGYDTVTLTGLRVQANIVNIAGSVHIGEAHVRVYGLTPSLLNQLSALNAPDMLARENTLIITAGDDVAGMRVVFQGTINLAQIDLQNVPDVYLTVYAVAGYFDAMKIAPPSSYPGHADVAVIMSNLAAQMGVGFENNGVSVMLSTPYLPGTLLDQVKRCAAAARIHYIIENNTLVIWPKGGCRGGVIPLISCETGMVGFPSYSTDLNGISVKTLFNPTVKIGGLVRIESGLKVANGNWKVFKQEHSLDSQTPDGQWFTHFSGSPYVIK